MNLEQRLQHASRELRAVPIVVPPLGHGATARPPRRSMVAPLLVPLLFVTGALFAIGVARTDARRAVQSDLPDVIGSQDPSTAAPPVEAADEPEVHIVDAPSALVELQLIADFVSSARAAETSTTSVQPVDVAARLASGVGPL